MRATRPTTLAVALVAAAALAAAPAADLPSNGGTAPGPAPTTVGAVGAAADGLTVTVTPEVDLGGQAPVELGFDPAGDAAVTPETAALGLDLTGIHAWVEDGDVPELTFAWHSTQLDRLPPPELVRFYWEFGVSGSQSAFSVQAKTSDVVSAGNLGDGSPQSVLNNLQSYQSQSVPQFRVRGNCGTLDPAPLSNCGHVAWVDGEFDFAANEIRLVLPLDLANAPIRPGTRIIPSQGAWASIQAAADNALTRDSVAQSLEYTIPAPSGTVTLTDADGTVVATAPLDFEAERPTASLTAPAAGTYTVTVQACFAGNCGSASSGVEVTG
ncbi:MAG: hypothetical protein ACLGIR_06130 [Actinomycetes bacterium]